MKGIAGPAHGGGLERRHRRRHAAMRKRRPDKDRSGRAADASNRADSLAVSKQRRYAGEAGVPRRCSRQGIGATGARSPGRFFRGPERCRDVRRFDNRGRRGSPVRAMRMLVAEDETIIRLDLRSLLESNGFEIVAEARDGEEAVALARELE